ncbi:MAG: DEAD/DEAH box helicase [Bacteroidales bacterium]|nr:DEAD/DEAH box helicase [Bacteroidales bacterium]MBR6876100.1 DEAD/DEAH box helicase [Bacteroidales bacterium]
MCMISVDLPVMEIAGAVNEALAGSPRLVVTAPPGAGKSTVLPLTILYGSHPDSLPGAETPLFAPDTKILVLEPRRLAARQIAERMAALLGEPVGRTVGYRIRFESRVSAATRIEVLTEGILTRMLVDDPALEGVGVVIFDEFHERSLQSDVALALTREAQSLLRPDLRILLMSATIDTEGLCRELDAPLLESAGRMFPVEIKHTPEEATAENVAERVAHWVRVALREHDGDILAFLLGEGEIRRCAELLDGLGGRGGENPGQARNDDRKSLSIYPLYGLLPPEQQRAAIAPSPAGSRKVVLATPIAETSLTIEGVRVVVDGGFCRRLVFDPQNALSRLEAVRISRDMADQRSGRAGRVAPGICYRLWSPATQARMAATRVPEILEADLAGTALDAAAWGESQLAALPWLTPPPAAHVAQATQLLGLLGALDDAGRITPHGRALAALPCHPRIAQMLLYATREWQNSAWPLSEAKSAPADRPAPGIWPIWPNTEADAASECIESSLSMPSRQEESNNIAKGFMAAGGSGDMPPYIELAAKIAALLEERDPLAANDHDAALTTRLEALHRAGRSGRWGRIAQMAEQYRMLAEKSAPKIAKNGADPTFETGLGAKNSQNRHRDFWPPAREDRRKVEIPGQARNDYMEVGRLLAAAYPERVAKALPEGRGHFQLATGERAAVAPEDALSACEWLAVASLSVRPGGEGRIFLAAPVDPEDLPELIRTRDRVVWDSKAGAALARRERRIGTLLVDARPLSEGVREQLTQVICEAAQKEGTAMLDFSDEVGNLQRRVAAVAAWHPELALPDLSTEAVLQSAPDWLPPFVGRATTVAELKKIDLCAALWTLLDYAQQQAVERLAPAHIAVPTGSHIRVEYRQGAEAPVLRVRLQECFGLLDTPRVDDGRRPVLMELLSPGYKPVQLTTDLRSFWSGTYFEVRKELRRRYPKHAWPDNPLEAEAVRGVKRNK